MQGLQGSSLAFDASTMEIWGALEWDALCLLPRETLLFPPLLAAKLHDDAISAAFLTTSLFLWLAAVFTYEFARIGEHAACAVRLRI